MVLGFDFERSVSGGEFSVRGSEVGIHDRRF